MGYMPIRVPTEIVQAHMFDARPGVQSPAMMPSVRTISRANEVIVRCTEEVGSTCQRCLRQSSGLVNAITTAPVTHDAPISFDIGRFDVLFKTLRTHQVAMAFSDFAGIGCEFHTTVVKPFFDGLREKKDDGSC
jgi:hypothetical protein